MKKRVLTALAAGLCIAVNTYAQVPSYVPSNGLVGWWPFNANANDESGNGNNGTVNGATLTSDRFGVANKAYSFDGVNDFIDISNLNNISYKPITYNLWMNLNTYNTINFPLEGGMQLIGRDWSGYYDIGCLILWHNPSANVNNDISYYIGQSATHSSYTPPLNSWINITMTLSSQDTIKFYINGNLQYTQYYPTNSSINGPFRIGAGAEPNPSLGRFHFDGKLDDIGVWNRALTQQEITTLYQGCNVTASIAPQSNTTFCQGGSVTLQANTGSGYTYQWYKNSVLISGASQSSYVATTSGNYTVKVIDGACNATSTAVTVTVNTNPTVSLASISAFTNYYAAPVTLSGTPTGGTYSGPGVSGNSFNPQQAGLGTASINYSYTNASNCSGSTTTSTIVYDTLGNICTTYDTLYTTVTDTLIIHTTLSLAPPNNHNTIKIYPNPASDHITIDNGNYAAMAGYSLSIKNNAGQVVFQSAINQAQFTVDLSTWSGNGIYFVHLLDNQNNTVTVRKIVLN